MSEIDQRADWLGAAFVATCNSVDTYVVNRNDPTVMTTQLTKQQLLDERTALSDRLARVDKELVEKWHVVDDRWVSKADE